MKRMFEWENSLCVGLTLYIKILYAHDLFVIFEIVSQEVSRSSSIVSNQIESEE